MSERAALVALDDAMCRYEVSRDQVEPLVAMKLAVVLDDTRDPRDEWCTCTPTHECEGHRA